MASDGHKLLLEHMSEREFQSWVRREADRNGWKVFAVWSSMHAPSGWPDLFMVRGSDAIAAELKRASGHLAADQPDWLDKLGLVTRVHSRVWQPSDEDDVRALLAGQPSFDLSLDRLSITPAGRLAIDSGSTGQHG